MPYFGTVGGDSLNLSVCILLKYDQISSSKNHGSGQWVLGR